MSNLDKLIMSKLNSQKSKSNEVPEIEETPNKEKVEKVPEMEDPAEEDEDDEDDEEEETPKEDPAKEEPVFEELKKDGVLGAGAKLFDAKTLRLVFAEFGEEFQLAIDEANALIKEGSREIRKNLKDLSENVSTVEEFLAAFELINQSFDAGIIKEGKRDNGGHLKASGKHKGKGRPAQRQ